tara:strand:+ start:89225 stop:90094 length:870 start_codon:yes stop_codon:yes gene_type:complete
MSWVTSAVVHTGMLAILGTALTSIPVVAPEVSGSRIVVMSSMADIASPDAVVRKVEHTPVRIFESPEESQLPPKKPAPPPFIEDVADSYRPPSPEPLQVVIASVKIPSLLQRRQLEQRRSSGQNITPTERRRRSPQVVDSESLESPTMARHQPEVVQSPSAIPIKPPSARRPKPAALQPASASTARQQSANSVARAVGTVPTKPAQAISNPNPVYPPVAVQQRLEGRVILSVTISTSGAVTKVVVAESCGHEVLDQAALDAVCQWRFSPATQDGMAVEWTARLPIRFRL